MEFFLLGLSVFLSTGRNIFSKKLFDIEFGTKAFFLCQTLLFLCGGVTVLLFGKIVWNSISPQTLIYAVTYALLLIFAQWFYTSALATGNTALCSTVYSLAFIFPTLSGAIFWSEPFSVFDAVGILCAVSAIIVSGTKQQKKEKEVKTGYFIPLIISMLAGGGLGIVQKVHQSSPYAEEKSVFLLISFVLATTISLSFALFSKKSNPVPLRKSKLAISSVIGICFGCCNILNTTLAGLLDTAVFFPTLNIGIILLSTLCGIMFFKEKISRRVLTVFALCCASILLLNFG